MGLIRVEQEDLTTALGRVQAFTLGRPLEVAAHIICADPVSLTWRFQKNYAAGLIATVGFRTAASFLAAANNARLRHADVEVLVAVGLVRSW